MTLLMGHDMTAKRVKAAIVMQRILVQKSFRLYLSGSYPLQEVPRHQRVIKLSVAAD